MSSINTLQRKLILQIFFSAPFSSFGKYDKFMELNVANK